MVSLPETTPPAVQPSAEEGEQPQQEQHYYNPLPPEAYVHCLTPAAKEKGDAGIYAALDAMQLSRALHGVTNSRLEPLSASATAATAAGGGVAGARVNNSSANNGTASGAVQLGMEPAVFRHGAAAEVRAIFSAAVVEAVEAAAGDSQAVRDAVRRGMEGASGGAASTAVGVPDTVEALERVVPLVHEVKPHDRLSYDALQRLFELMEAAAVAPPAAAASADAEGTGVGVATLLLSHGVMDPAQQPAPSATALEAMYYDVQARYPLPVPAAASTNEGDGDEEEAEEEDDDEEGSADAKKHNAALQERCAALQIPYTSYNQAARDVASYEMRVFPLLCAYLRDNETCRTQEMVRLDSHTGAADAVRHRACVNVKVLDLSHNNIGAAAVPSSGKNAGAGGAPVRSLAPLRALAAMIDSNESLRYLNLRANVLGPKGTGIIAKALTKNIALTGIDLSVNGLGGGGGANAAAAEAAEAEEVEDPLHEEEDPVFGDVYEGLEALAEVLKKNKFLRVLRLGENGLHAGEELAGAPPPEDEPEEDSGNGATRGGMSIADAQERWQSAPLWALLSPLCRYHRLRVLDLSKNFLGNTGAQMVAVALSHNRSIEVLDLTDNAIGYAGLSYLARYVLDTPPPAAGAAAVTSSSSFSPYQQKPRVSPLHTLILRQNPLAAVGGAADAATGVDMQRRRLTKRQQKQATNAMNSFATALQRHGGLRRLILSNAYLGPAASAVLLRALAQVPTLEELDFSFNNACGDHVATFDATAVPHIAALLYPAAAAASTEVLPSQLRRLCLDGNNLTSAGLSALLPADPNTSVLRSLRELTLSRNGLGDALDPLCQLITRGVTRLDLSYNDITSLIALLPALSVAASPLEELNLSHNKLGVQEGLLRELPAARQEEEVTQAFQCIARLPHLAVLDVSYNDWKRAHVEQLGAVFADPALATQLRKLDVRHTPLVPAAPLMALLQYVASRPTMEVFLASIPVEKPESPEAAQTDAAAVAEGEGVPAQRWTYDAILEVIHGVVSASDSLLEVDCGLRAGDATTAAAVAADVSDAETTDETLAARVAQIRERLLLNALVAAARRPTADAEEMEA